MLTIHIPSTISVPSLLDAMSAIDVDGYEWAGCRVEGADVVVEYERIAA